ncbi:MAG: hypothetical protein WBO66_04390, partial [Candidatus Moraniibacteriota bacterium]
MKQIYYWYSKKSLDWWSIPHFLFGVVMAFLALVLAWPLSFTFGAMLIIAILWEGFERRIRIRESRSNSKMDILLPLLAFLLTLF